MRAFLLVAILLSLVGAALLVQRLRYDAPARAAEAPGPAGHIVLEIGGGPPPRALPRVEVAPTPAPAPKPPIETNDVVPAKPPAPVAPPPPAADGVRVAKGETISLLAKRHYGSAAPSVWKDIAKANGLADATKLREGTLLTLPPSAGGKPRQK